MYITGLFIDTRRGELYRETQENDRVGKEMLTVLNPVNFPETVEQSNCFRILEHKLSENTRQQKEIKRIDKKKR